MDRCLRLTPKQYDLGVRCVCFSSKAPEKHKQLFPEIKIPNPPPGQMSPPLADGIKMRDLHLPSKTKSGQQSAKG